jgi:Rha family phage regulatory protein
MPWIFRAMDKPLYSLDCSCSFFQSNFGPVKYKGKTVGADLVVYGENGMPVTTSLKVADVFGKQHKNVMRDIKTLDCSGPFRGLNFELTHEAAKIGIATRTIPVYEITRDGFTFLAMGFTGKKAAQFKEKYIAEFNRMEKGGSIKPLFRAEPPPFSARYLKKGGSPISPIDGHRDHFSPGRRVRQNKSDDSHPYTSLKY